METGVSHNKRRLHQVKYLRQLLETNNEVQRVLVEAAKLAPKQSHELALVYEKAKLKGNTNRATIAVARKMVTYLLQWIAPSAPLCQQKISAPRQPKPRLPEKDSITQRAGCQVLQIAD